MTMPPVSCQPDYLETKALSIIVLSGLTDNALLSAKLAVDQLLEVPCSNFHSVSSLRMYPRFSV